jgi:hypothetical protein
MRALSCANRWRYQHECHLKISNKVSAVGIATCYGLDGPRIQSRWRRDFPHPSKTALGPTASYTLGLPRR